MNDAATQEAMARPWRVASYNRRAMQATADERVVYRGPSRAEAIRIFEGLAKWKRRGIVEMVSPWGTVSTVCETGDPATSWRTEYAHGYPFDSVPVQQTPASSSPTVAGCT